MDKQRKPVADVWYSPEEMRQYASMKLIQSLASITAKQVSEMKIAEHGADMHDELGDLLQEVFTLLLNVSMRVDDALDAHGRSEYERMYEVVPEQAESE